MIKSPAIKVNPNVLKTLRESSGYTVEEIEIVDLPKIDSAVGKVEKELEPIITAKRSVTEKMAELTSLRTQIEALGPAGLPVPGLMRSTLLASSIGMIEEAQLEPLRSRLASIPSIVLPSGVFSLSPLTNLLTQLSTQ